MKTDPSAEVVETFATSIGARSQSARTFLERQLDKFPDGKLVVLVICCCLPLCKDLSIFQLA